MAQELDLLSNLELGRLFPIIISNPIPDWPDLFVVEKDKIENAIGIDNIGRIEHVGSTAVPALKAKPCIDILLEIKDRTEKEYLIEKLKSLGYHFIPQLDNPPPHMMFVKGYTIHGFVGQAYHIHIRYKGNWDELYFRDYLIAHPKVAKEYEKLKLELAQVHKNDRDAYTNGKTKFITKITRRAKNESK